LDSLTRSTRQIRVKLTPYDDITSYNNFYEWGLEKGDPKVNANKGWKTEPWTIEIGGLCAKPAKYEVNDLIKAVGGIEQRNYRHRCVEAWSMVIPWDGFALAKLVAIAEPKAEAKFIQFNMQLLVQRDNSLPGGGPCQPISHHLVECGAAFGSDFG
jgi:methionine sulfoxide reductase catalytic subunit